MLTVLYSNSNEIIHLIESVCGFHVSPLGCIDEEEGVDNLLLFDILFYEKPQHDWTTSWTISSTSWVGMADSSFTEIRRT